MNKAIKIVVAISLIVMVLVAGVAGFIFYKLPSVGSLSKIVRPNKQKNVDVSENSKPIEVIEGTPKPSLGSVGADAAADKEGAVDAAKTAFQEKALEDLTSSAVPLSNFCGSLKNAKTGRLTEDEFGDAFEKSVSADTQDPRIQAAKPAIRYMLRLPTVSNLISEIEAAGGEPEQQDFVAKAKFYALAYSAYGEMKQHQGEIESALDRGYLYMGLNNLVAQKPELANDPKIQSFCSSAETAFNQSSALDFEREKKDFLTLLAGSGVQAKDIGFDPNYKTTIELKLENNSLTMNGGWLEDLIQEEEEGGDSDSAIDVSR